MSKIKILIADDIEEARKVIIKLLSLANDEFQVVGEACNGEEVLKLIPKVQPDVVLMDINMPILNGLEATEQITNQFQKVIVIIMSVQAETEYLKKAMFYGAKEYIFKPFNFESLVDTIKNTYDKYSEKLARQAFQEGKDYQGKIITFFSSKGGVGKSVLAVNSAIILSKEAHKKTLLLDLDLQFGDISMLINQYNKKTILDLVEDGQLENYENIKPYVYSYNDSLDIIFAPRKPESAEYISKDSIEKLIENLKKHYELIIIDTGINFNDTTLYALDASETILFVSTMEIVALKNTKLGFGVMQSLGYDKNKVKLVINKYNQSYGISRNEIETIFKDNILAMLPQEDKTVCMSVNKGEPFCDTPKYYKEKLRKAIQTMCEELIK